MRLVPVVLGVLHCGAHSREHAAKCGTPPLIRRSLFELQLANVLEEGGVLPGHVAAQLTRLHLVLHQANLQVLLPYVRRGDVLPGQTALREEDHHVEGRLEVVSPTQLLAGVIVHGDVAWSAGDRLTSAKGDVGVVVVEVLLAESHICEQRYCLERVKLWQKKTNSPMRTTVAHLSLFG